MVVVTITITDESFCPGRKGPQVQAGKNFMGAPVQLIRQKRDSEPRTCTPALVYSKQYMLRPLDSPSNSSIKLNILTRISRANYRRKDLLLRVVRDSYWGAVEWTA